jgi:phospholipase/carboxylesterase
MAEILEAIVHDTGPEPKRCVIWMHGLGADGHDFAPIVPELGLPRGTPVRFVFPHAPMQAVTINGGYVMRAWYDIIGTDLSRREDVAGVQASQAKIEAIIAREKSNGIAAASIVLAGFSQGGVIALQTGLRHAERIAGVMALSTYLSQPDALATERNTANDDVPIFMAHGVQDPVIALAHAKRSQEKLVELGYSVEWHTYAMPHSVCPEEIRDIGNWLKKVLKL